MQKLSPNPGRDFARVRVIARLVTSAACENHSSGDSPLSPAAALANTLAAFYVPRLDSLCQSQPNFSNSLPHFGQGVRNGEVRFNAGYRRQDMIQNLLRRHPERSTARADL